MQYAPIRLLVAGLAIKSICQIDLENLSFTLYRVKVCQVKKHEYINV